MGLISKVQLLNDGEQLKDVQLWGSTRDVSLSSLQLSRRDYVNYRGLPLYLIQGPPMDVYSNSAETSNFFTNLLILCALQDNNVGMLFGDDRAMTYLVFYYDITIKAIILDFKSISTIMSYIENSKTSPTYNFFLDFAEPVRRDSTNITVFDKVLNKKKRPSPETKSDFDDASSPFTDPLPRTSSLSRQNSHSFTSSSSFSLSRQNSHSRSVLTSHEQINLAINKLILSGLRIRGLSTNLNHSINDKLTIKEIYNMTLKSALFSLRKYNYNFTTSNKSRAIGFADLQDTVEKLLDIYVDVNPN